MRNLKKGVNKMALELKQWNFTFSTYGCRCVAHHTFDECDRKGTDWGWNSVTAKTKKTAIKEALKWCNEYGKSSSHEQITLNDDSVNCNEHTEKMLLSNFY